MMNPSGKPRVNGEVIINFKGRVVCALGKLKKINQDGMSFVMTLSDGADVEVFMSEELDRSTEGMIEVMGEVGGTGHQIQLQSHRVLGDVEFDMNLYNEAIKLTHQFPEYYSGAGQSV